MGREAGALLRPEGGREAGALLETPAELGEGAQE